VERAVTAAAQDDEVSFAIGSRLAPADHVVDLELIAPAATLAFPAIPLENFQLELAVSFEVEPKPWRSRFFITSPTLK